MQEAEMIERLLAVGYDDMLIIGRHQTPDQLEQEIQIGYFLAAPRAAAVIACLQQIAAQVVGGRSGTRRTAQIQIFAQHFDVVGLLEETLIRIVHLEQIEQQVEAVLDNDAAVDHTALALNDLHDPVEATLKRNYLLYVGVCFGQIVEQQNCLKFKNMFKTLTLN